jgi:DNA-binding Xre family transcriptional regulator
MTLAQAVPVVLTRRWEAAGCRGLSESSIWQLKRAGPNGMTLRMLADYCRALRCRPSEVIREAEAMVAG